MWLGRRGRAVARHSDDPRSGGSDHEAAWQKTAARYDSEPETGEGRKEISERAKEAEEHRDLGIARYHHYEIGSAAFQIGIVLASGAVITGMMALTWLAGCLGLAGLALTAIGLFTPTPCIFSNMRNQLILSDDAGRRRDP